MSRSGPYEEASFGTRRCRCGAEGARFRMRVTGRQPRGEFLCDVCEEENNIVLREIKERAAEQPLDQFPACNRRWLECICFPERKGL